MKWLLIALIVIPGTIADVLNAKGMKRNGEFPAACAAQ